MKKAIMYGAGNIGRGFIGQLFYESGYETVFIDVNMAVIDKINADRSYPIYITENEDYREYTVKNVRGVNGRDNEAIAAEFADADIAATAVGVNILRFIAAPIALGIKRRYELKVEAPLNIIICENMLDADKYFISLVKANLNEDEQAYFDSHIGIVEPSIGRMVPVTPLVFSEKNPLSVCVEQYCELPVDRKGFKGELPAIKHMVPFTPFGFYIQRKLFMHNMSHALTSYFGSLKGYTYVWEAARDAEIKLIALRALIESSRALSKEHGIELEQLIDTSENLINRFENKLLGDTIERVGRDTKRKLSENDRFAGTIKLCVKHGIMPYNICAGLAAGLMFAPESDAASIEVKTAVERNGIDVALAQYCSIDAASEPAIVIKEIYSKLKSGTPLSEIISSLQTK